MSKSNTGSTMELYKIVEGTPRSWWKSMDGKMEVEISETTHDKKCSCDLMRLWIEHGYTSKWLDTTLSVHVYYTDDKGNCWCWYNPTCRLSESGTRMVLDFDWMLESTPENVRLILDECERMRREDIRIKPARS